jgi:hypothetical protein
MGSQHMDSHRASVHPEIVAGPHRDVVASRRRLVGMEGFRVDGPDGRVGYVKRVSSTTSGGAPDTLHVATGLFIVRVVPIPASEIVDVEPERRRLVIRQMVRRPRPPRIAQVVCCFLASIGNDTPRGNGATPAKGGR